MSNHRFAASCRVGARAYFHVALLALAAGFLASCGGGGSSAPPPAPQVSVTVTPATASPLLGAAQQFSATVINASSTAVTWSVATVTGGNSTLGTINSSGLYTAPNDLPNPATVTVTATSQADTTQSASATVTITSDVTVTVTSSAGSVETGGTLKLTAAVNSKGKPDKTVTWSVNGVKNGNATVGTLTTTGSDTATYTAPSAVPSPAGIRIQATSVADPTKSAAASVTVTVIPVQVAISPVSPTVSTGGTQQFTATVTGSSNGAVTWSVNGVAGGNSTVGTISSAGLYTAPTTAPSPSTVTITATSTADPTKSASATVAITAAGTAAVTLSTNSVSFGNQAVGTTNSGQTVVLTNSGTAPLSISSASVSGADFVQFDNCPGPAGTLTPGALCSFNVFFTPSAAAAETATLAITDNAPGSPHMVSLSGTGVTQAVNVSPVSGSVETGFSQLFIATVTGVTDTSVNWSVNGIAGGDSTVGSITTGGIYTAPFSVPSPNTVTVTGASVASPTLSASATVTIVPAIAMVVVNPASATVQTGATEQLAASVTDAANTLVTWSVNGVANGNSTVGTIGAGGNVVTYTAPAVVPSPATVTVTATSAADTTVSASSTLTIAATSGIGITSLDKTSLPPFQLLTISGTGFNPQGTTFVNFSNSSGFSLDVPPVSVTANSVVVGVPPYFAPDTGDLAPGTVSVQVVQSLMGIGSTSSNSVAGFLIQEPPTTTLPPGTVTLAFLNGESNFVRTLNTEIGFFGDFNLSTSEMQGALAVESSALQAIIPQVFAVSQNPTQTFALAMPSSGPVTVGSADLGKLDRLILGMLAAQAASTFKPPTDDSPACIASGGAQNLDAILGNGTGTITSVQVSNMLGGSFSQCRAAGVVSTLHTIDAVWATGLAVLALLEAPPVVVAAGTAGLLVFVAATFDGEIAAGGYLGQGTSGSQTLLQGAVNQFDNLIKVPLLAVGGSLVPENVQTPYHLLHLLFDANELRHAVEQAPPYNGGPPPASTNTLTVSTTGTGGGITVSLPGGLVCGPPDSTSCVVPFPTGETVYLDNQPATGSTSQGFTGACTGASCTVVMNADQTVTADFQPVPPPTFSISFSGALTGSVTDEGQGGCNGGAGGTASITGTVTMSASPLSAGEYSYTGTVTLSQGFGICDDYSGTYPFSGQVPSLTGGSTAFFFGPAFGSGTFANGNSFSGSWSFSVNVGPDVANGTMSLTSP